MTNEQKANEIAENESRFYKQLESGKLTSSKNDCQRSALAMAEWKDQQLIKFLEDRMGDEILCKTIEEFKEIINGEKQEEVTYCLTSEVGVNLILTISF